MKKLKQKRCKNCKTLFTPSYLHRVHCSANCMEEYLTNSRKHKQVRRRIIESKSVAYKEYICHRCGGTYAKADKLDRFDVQGFAYFYCECRDSHPEMMAVI